MQWNIVLPLIVMTCIYQVKTLVEAQHIKYTNVELLLLQQAWGREEMKHPSPVLHLRDALTVFPKMFRWEE